MQAVAYVFIFAGFLCAAIEIYLRRVRAKYSKPHNYVIGEKGTIAVDFDGTLCTYVLSPKLSPEIHGEPVPSMVERVKLWLNQGRDVVIFTARATTQEAIPPVEDWCEKHLGRKLKVTNIKTLDIVEIWDDRAISVKVNTGEFLDANEGNRQIPFIIRKENT